jgi:hypothetical protein
MNRRRFLLTLAALPAAALAVATAEPETFTRADYLELRAYLDDPELPERLVRHQLQQVRDEWIKQHAETDWIYRQAMLDADRLTDQLRDFTAQIRIEPNYAHGVDSLEVSS